MTDGYPGKGFSGGLVPGATTFTDAVTLNPTSGSTVPLTINHPTGSTAHSVDSTGSYVQTLASDVIGLSITLSNGQTQNAIDINSYGSTGGNLFKIDSGGSVTISPTTGSLRINIGTHGTSTNDALAVYDSTSQLLFKVDQVGQLTVGSYASFSNDILCATSVRTSQNFVCNGSLICQTAGGGLQVTGGTNAKVGTGTLTAGSANISTTAVTAGSMIFLQRYGSTTNAGALNVTSQTASTGFTVNSTNASDAGTFYWMIVEKL